VKRKPRYALRTKTVEVDEMVEQLMRAVEAQISLSLNIARSGAVFAGRVASWALNEVARQVLPDREDGAASSAADEHPAGSASASTWQPEVVDGAQEPEPVSPPEEELPTVSVIEEEVEAVSVTAEEPEAVSAGEAQPAALSPSDEEREAAKSAADEETPPSGATETETHVTQTEPPPIGGEDGGVVEHEPGMGTSVRARDPHSPLNNPVAEADLTEWPDPYDHREDPLDPGEEMVFGGEAGHTQTGATSTSEPHPSQDPEAAHWEGPKRDKVDR
jgi:hypothetical protein